MMVRKVIVKQAEGKPEVTTEVLAQSIREIAEGMRSLRRGRLNDKALVLLIHHAAKPATKYGAKPSQSDVRIVLDAIESLDAQYLRK